MHRPPFLLPLVPLPSRTPRIVRQYPTYHAHASMIAEQTKKLPEYTFRQLFSHSARSIIQFAACAFGFEIAGFPNDNAR